VHRDVQQNLDEQNLDVNRPCLVLVRHFLVHLQDVVVDVELRHLLKMDCYLDVVGVELHHQLKMDCCQVVALEQMVLAQQVLKQQCFQLHAVLTPSWQPHALQPLPY
jgi:hypothetical protein